MGKDKTQDSQEEKDKRLGKLILEMEQEFPLLLENYDIQKTSKKVFTFLEQEYNYEKYLEVTNSIPITRNAVVYTWVVAFLVYMICLNGISYLNDKALINEYVAAFVFVPISIFLCYRYIISYSNSIIYNYFGNFAAMLEDEYYCYMLGMDKKDYYLLKKFLKPESLYVSTPMISLFVVNSFCEVGYFKKYFKNDIELPMENISTLEELINYVKENDKTKYYF